MMLVFYLECGFSLLPNRKSFARGTPFLLRDVKKCQYFFINDLVHLNPTLTQVERNAVQNSETMCNSLGVN
jgi:hypothetical protein